MVADVMFMEKAPLAPLIDTVRLAEPGFEILNEAVDVSPTLVSLNISDDKSTEMAGFFTSSAVVNLFTLP